MKFPLHSTTDLITNSSTTIFTYSDGAEAALVELIDEIFTSFGIDKKCEDVFDTVVLADSYTYTDVDDDYIPEGVDPESIDQLYEDVKAGKVEKPQFFNEIEEMENGYYCPSTYLHLIPKKESYDKLAQLVKKFLYSPYHEASNDY